MEEIWKPVPIDGFSSYYSISSAGRVRSEPRIIIRKNGVRNRVKGRILRQSLAGAGYLSVMLNGENESKRLYPHRLVAMAFLPTPESEDLQVNHINGYKLDNSTANLEWCTQSENKSHAASTGLMNGKKNMHFTRPGGFMAVYVARDALTGSLRHFNGVKGLSSAGFNHGSVRRAMISKRPYKGFYFSQQENKCTDLKQAKKDRARESSRRGMAKSRLAAKSHAACCAPNGTA